MTDTPQVEDGYTRIANELMEAILRHPFSKRELLVVWAIIRKTYGFNKKADDMSGQQLADLTGLKRQHVNVCVRDLALKKVVLKRDGQYGQVLGINKKYGEWLLVPKQDYLVPKRDTSQNRTTASPETGLELVPKQDTQKTTPKDTTKRQRAQPSASPETGLAIPGLNKPAWDEYIAYRKQAKKGVLKPASITKQQKWLVEQGPPDIQQKIVDQSIRNNWQGLFELKGIDHAAHRQVGKPSLAERVSTSGREALRTIAEREAAGGAVDEDGSPVRPPLDGDFRRVGND